MPLAPLPFQVLAEIALAVVDATDLQSAVELLATELSALFNTHAILFERRARRWVAVAGAEDDSKEHEWQVQLAGVVARQPGLFSYLSNPAGGKATAISLTGPNGPDVALVVDGDWTADRSTLKVFALLVSMGLDSLRLRETQRAAGRRVMSGYSMARRWSRLGSVERVAQQVVEQIGELVDAERVSLALYNRTDDALAIVATHGYPHADVANVRIPPGAWVMGHVYSQARPLFVSDARLFPGTRREQYRTHSFAAVPLIAGSEILGVLAVTERRDGTAFSRDDETALRGMSLVAALAIVAARSNAEAAKLAYAATVDSVTHLLNRPYFDSRLHEEVERTRREGTTLAVLIGDIDDFKRVNDSFGHQVGDQVLKVVGGIVRSAVRVFDVCARYGGDEFAILMPNCDRKSALACAERIRLRIAQYDGGENGVTLPPLTVSIGAAVIEKGEDGAAVMARADQHLYQAKADGKNVVRAGSTEDELRAAPSVNGAAMVNGGVNRGIGRSEIATGNPRQTRYVLIAGMSDDRAAFCGDIVKPFGFNVSIARRSNQAVTVIQQLGPPLALIVDLASPWADGFTVIDALRGESTEIIAWSASHEVTEYAKSRLLSPHMRVLSSAAPPSAIRSTIEKVLRAHAAEGAGGGSVTAVEHDGDKIMKTLADKTRHVCDAPGVAVYLKAPGDTAFRTVLSWASADAIPHLPHALPRAFNQVVETGQPVVLPDIQGPSPSDDVPLEAIEDATGGLVAVPITFAGHVVGAICVFDIRPLALRDRDFAALRAIGREAFAAAAPATQANVEAGGAQVFRDRAIDRRAQTAAAVNGATPRVDWPPAILERTGGEFAVARELARARREGCQLSVVLFDVEPAPAENAPNEAVDDRLQAVSETLLRTIRQSDLPIRWSVSELLVVLPGLKGSEARAVAERVRAALQAGSGHRLQVSGGVAELEDEERFADVVDRARQKVAMAVGRGHNRVL